jgi:Zn-dependent peptidase ImmA (M78 family)/transcriptional regulator with XRE-family HTH domain
MSLAETIRAARTAANMASKDLAEASGLSPAAFSQIENGKRAVKADEIMSIADALGVSPLALLEPESLAARVSLAARTTATIPAADSALLQRLQGLVEAASLVGDEYDRIGPPNGWGDRPNVDLAQWLPSAKALAAWALTRVALSDTENTSDHFVSLANQIQHSLGVDVLVEDFTDLVIGGAIVGEEFPVIAINASQGRQRALFTLAHELGHVLAAAGLQLSCDANVDSTSPDERFANAFAAEFLLPSGRVRALTEGAEDIHDGVASLMTGAGVSKQTAVYRLHNLGMISASQRDYLKNLRMPALVREVHDDRLRSQLIGRADTLAPRSVLPLRTLERLLEGFRVGEVSAVPVADILGQEVESFLEEYAEQYPSPDLEEDTALSQALPSFNEDAYEGVPA